MHPNFSIEDQPMNTPEPINPIQRRYRTVSIPARTIEAPARLFFGGTFDPPHLAHTELPVLAAQILEQDLDLPAGSCNLVYVPAARSPHKDADPTPDHHRVEMLNIALRDLQHPAVLWCQEIDDSLLNPGQPSYWADTWSIALSMTGNGVNRFLIGADQALAMHRWCRYTEIWKDAIVVLRDEAHSTDALLEALRATGVWSSDDLEHWKSSCIPLPLAPYSSTNIRNSLAGGRSITDSEIKSPASTQRNTRIEGLDPGVLSYILDHGLYR